MAPRIPRLLSLLCLAPLVACSSGGTTSSAPAPGSSASPVTSPVGTPPTPVAATSSTASVDPASSTPVPSAGCSALAGRLSRQEQVGQLFMVGTSSTTPDATLRELVTTHHVGSVLYLGPGPWTLAGTRQSSATIASWGGAVPVLLAADQEGGRVQRLAGAGFDPIPSATRQGQLAPAELTRRWARWGGQLRDAGVLFDLAPVADVVPAGHDATNDPVGAMDRNYGTSAETVGAGSSAVVTGLRQARVASSLKHYPGLGRTDVNTDFGVADDTRTTAADVEDYRPAMEAGASSVMVSSSTYEQLDPGVPAVFSSRIITGLLRGEQGWTKAVVSDDLGAAAAVASTPPAQRGVRFLRAGGDLVIDADPALLPTMVQGVLDAAATDEAFAATLDDHAARVLALKAEVGLVDCSAG